MTEPRTTISLDDKQRAIVTELTRRLVDALGERLVAAVLYGPAAHGERAAERELAILVVLSDLTPPTLRCLRDPLAFARKRGLPVPRLFSPALLVSSRDVFPLEHLDLAAHREILHGADPFGGGAGIDDAHLRIQCEREIAEKLMRLREAYAGAGGKPRELQRLLVDSYPVFVHVLRGALRLVGEPLPERGLEVARAFCRIAGLDERAFVEIDALRRGERGGAPPDEVFARYYGALEGAADFIDRRGVAPATTSQQGATQ